MKVSTNWLKDYINLDGYTMKNYLIKFLSI